MCVYLNTQCGWVLQANYTGPVTSCLPTTTMTIEGIDLPFHDMTVGDFRAGVAAEFFVNISAVRILAHESGHIQAAFTKMEDLAASAHGFDVVIEGRRHHFSRS